MFDFNSTVYADNLREPKETKVNVNVNLPKEIKVNQNNDDIDRLNFILNNKNEFVDGVIWIDELSDIAQQILSGVGSYILRYYNGEPKILYFKFEEKRLALSSELTDSCLNSLEKYIEDNYNLYNHIRISQDFLNKQTEIRVILEMRKYKREINV